VPFLYLLLQQHTKGHIAWALNKWWWWCKL